MEIDVPLPLLGGLSPAQFMRRHWQKKPLLVRQAWPGVVPPLDRAALFALAGQEGVEARLLSAFEGHWRLRHGPFGRRALPPLAKPGWTLLLQGLDLHVPAAHTMLQAFRFVPEARLDDLMISWASPGGGVGPHLDSYDVFLLQVQGQRRWRIGPVADRSLVDGLPVKILRHFAPDQDWVLEPGDMLYLPPHWGHDGTAVDECMTCSIGFRTPAAGELAQQLLQALAEDLDEDAHPTRYRDPAQPATTTPGRVPPALREFAVRSLARALKDEAALDRALGALLSEPKPQVWFDPGQALPAHAVALRLDRRTRMLYDTRHVFINGEAFVAGGRDARLMQQLADRRELPAQACRQLSDDAQALLADWAEAGWLHAAGPG